MLLVQFAGFLTDLDRGDAEMFLHAFNSSYCYWRSWSATMYANDMGAILVEADLSFAPKEAILRAVEKAYPTALKIATSKGQC